MAPLVDELFGKLRGVVRAVCDHMSTLNESHELLSPIERVPEFWDWLAEMGRPGRVKIPQEVYEEVVLPKPENPDVLVDWLSDHREDLVLDEAVEVELVAQVTEQGFANDLSDDEIEKVGRDPFIIAYPIACAPDRCVVTNERSRPGRTRANRHLPDVSHQLLVRCKSTFDLIQELDFRTNWRTPN